MKQTDDIPQCLKCGYDLSGASRTCPECGNAFDPDNPGTFNTRNRRRRAVLASGLKGTVIGLVAAVIFFVVAASGVFRESHWALYLVPYSALAPTLALPLFWAQFIAYGAVLGAASATSPSKLRLALVLLTGIHVVACILLP